MGEKCTLTTFSCLFKFFFTIPVHLCLLIYHVSWPVFWVGFGRFFGGWGGNRNRNDKQLELNACMLAPTPLLICQSPTVVRKRSRMAITKSNWTTEVAVVTLSGFG